MNHGFHTKAGRTKLFTETDKDLVVNHPEKSVRQIAAELTEGRALSINYHSVADILKQRSVTSPPFSTSLLNFRAAPKMMRR